MTNVCPVFVYFLLRRYDKLVSAVAERSAGLRNALNRASAAAPADGSSAAGGGEAAAKRWIREAVHGQELSASIQVWGDHCLSSFL